jgi:hypothetical protein
MVRTHVVVHYFGDAVTVQFVLQTLDELKAFAVAQGAELTPEPWRDTAVRKGKQVRSSSVALTCGAMKVLVGCIEFEYRDMPQPAAAAPADVHDQAHADPSTSTPTGGVR